MQQRILLILLGTALVAGSLPPSIRASGGLPGWVDGIGNPGLTEPDKVGYLITRALTVFDDGTGPALYAGGLFTKADGIAATGIAKWDGVNWSPVGGGVTGLPRVYSLLAHNDGSGPVLYVGGSFTLAGNVSAEAIAVWDGASWTALGGGLSGGEPTTIVHTLCMFDDGTGSALYAGGRFTHADGQPVNYVAKWDGVQWSSLGGGMNYKVNALAVYNDGTGDALYAAGMFSQAVGRTVNGIAKWDGTSWTTLAGGMDFPYRWCRSLAVFDDGSGSALYVGGQFTEVGVSAEGGKIPATKIARWDGQNWSALGDGLGAWVTSIVSFDDGSGAALYAGGKYTTTGQESANYIAKWVSQEQRWNPLGSGMDYNIYTLGVFDDGFGPDLYAGGWFTTAGGQVASAVAQWDGCLKLPGNLDADGDLGLDDWSMWPACLAGPLQTVTPPCRRADVDGDGDGDLSDVASFLRGF